MSDVQKQTSSGQHYLPTLRKRLKNPRVWLTFSGLIIVVLIVDLRRDPPNQASARLYVNAVRGYQAFVSPGIRRFVRCRYDPSCSEYSIQAVKRYGLLEGLELTVARICRCTSGVPIGTCDPVPDVWTGKERRADKRSDTTVENEVIVSTRVGHETSASGHVSGDSNQGN